MALNNDNSTRGLCGDACWPRQAIVNPEGRNFYEHFGESGYGEIEANLVSVLKNCGIAIDDEFSSRRRSSPDEFDQFLLQMNGSLRTPEIYLGYKRSKGFSNLLMGPPRIPTRYADVAERLHDLVYLEGTWIQDAEGIRHANSEPAYIVLRYTARTVTVVLEPTDGSMF